MLVSVHTLIWCCQAPKFNKKS